MRGSQQFQVIDSLTSRIYKMSSLSAFILFVLMILQMPGTAQESSKYVMYQNSYSAFNPGYTGLQSKYFASLSSNFPGKKRIHFYNEIKDFFNAETLIYEQKLDKLSGGVGANISYENINDVFCDLTIAVNYSYHIDLPDFGTIGVGISAGRIFRTFKDLSYTDDIYNPMAHRIIDTTGAKTYLSFGLAYKFRNLNFGIGIGEMYPIAPKKNPNLFFKKPNYAVNINASYDVKLSAKSTLIPSVYVAAFPNDIYRIDYKLMFDYNKRIWVAGTYSDLRQVRYKDRAIYFSVGTDIQGKYRIGYTLSRNESLIGSPIEYHELVLALILN